jgi:type II secretory pathway component GspD/PulD (secretin)
MNTKRNQKGEAMTTKILKLTFALVIVLMPLTLATAQQKEPVYAETRFSAKVFELKHRDPQELYSTISVLGSGFKGTTVTYNSSNRTIAVRDFPENLATIEEALKRLDVPSTRSEPSIELSFHVLLTNTGHPSEQLPADLKDVMKQLQNTLSFKDYQLVTTIVQRAKARGRMGGNALNGNGNAIWKELLEDGRTASSNADYSYRANSLEAVTSSSGTALVQMNDFAFGFGKSGVQSNLELRDGEKVVVGTSSFGNKAMILVLSAKITK